MEWRIIVPVLCLIGIIHVPGNAAQANTNTSIEHRFSLRFSIIADFQSEYSNIASNAAIQLKSNITSQVEPVFKANYTNFLGFNISQFSNGSIVTDGELQFSNGSKPNVTDLTQILTNANITIKINTTTIKIIDLPQPPATTPAAPTTTTTVVPAKISKINLVFKIIQDFKESYSNLSHPETIELTNNITTGVSKVYKNRFPKFHRMTIQKFSQGSIVADSVLEFDSTNGSSVPNASQVKDTLTEAIASNQLSFKVDNTSINATVIPDTTATTVSAASSLTEYNITFKMNEIFSNDLSNRTSAAAIKLATNVTTELDNFFKAFTNFNRSVVLQFRNGSVVVDGQLGFNKNGNNPAVGDLAKGLAAAVRAGIVKLTIDPKSITITDPTGQVANRSPVLASMLTALWMTLASLLLSAVMH